MGEETNRPINSLADVERFGDADLEVVRAKLDVALSDMADGADYKCSVNVGVKSRKKDARLPRHVGWFHVEGFSLVARYAATVRDLKAENEKLKAMLHLIRKGVTWTHIQ